jgi:pimeloyl-ACP methyl ester carboxylesterase
MPASPPESLLALTGRFDPEAFDLGRRRARIRLTGASPEAFDVLLDGQRATLVAASGSRPDAVLRADAETWKSIADDLRGGMTAFRRGRLRIRHARYDAPFFASAMTALLDALGLERADIVGNSMGGRVALEIGLSAPDRVRRLALLAPSLAWLRSRPWAPYLKLVAPQLGLIQPAPRAIVEGIVRRVVPGSEEEWTAAGIDEFLRSYLTPRGRAAFYGAARNIYLEEPYGPNGFWTRLPGLAPESLFVWGRRDPLVPIRFARHVREALPHAAHLELRCGHVPQLERPKETHEAILRFLADGNR